jgi:ParB/RepB/Spo0J family partition protein
MTEQNQQLTLIPDERVEPKYKDVPLTELPGDEQLPGEAPDRAFVESVERFGVLQPVVLLKAAKGYEVAAGRRRVKAARAAGLMKIPARVYPPEWALSAVLAIVENEQRTSNVYVDLLSIEALMEAGAGEDDVVRATGMSKHTIRSRLRLARLIDPLRTALGDHQISVSTAEAAARRTVPEQHRLADVLAQNGKLTLADVRSVGRAETASAVDSLPDQMFSTPGLDTDTAEDWAAQVLRLLDQARALLPDYALQAQVACSHFRDVIESAQVPA